MHNQKHNGWTNYATWRINLEFGFFDSPEEYQKYTPEMLKEYVEDALEDECREDRSYVLSYALSFISDVNWDEIHTKLQED